MRRYPFSFLLTLCLRPSHRRGSTAGLAIGRKKTHHVYRSLIVCCWSPRSCMVIRRTFIDIQDQTPQHRCARTKSGPPKFVTHSRSFIQTVSSTTPSSETDAPVSDQECLPHEGPLPQAICNTRFYIFTLASSYGCKSQSKRQKIRNINTFSEATQATFSKY